MLLPTQEFQVLANSRDEPNLREVQAFKESTTGMDNLMGFISSLTEIQLKELVIRVREEKKNE